MSEPSYLIHYASEYYDPVKAHEYYEEHKKLKGRTSTSKLNEEGRKVAQYVKKQINEQRDKDIETERDNKNDSIENYKNEMSNKIESLRDSLKRMTPYQRSRKKEQITAMIDSLRQENQDKREELNEKFKETKTNIRDDASAKYESELEKIHSESKYLKKSKDTNDSSPVVPKKKKVVASKPKETRVGNYYTKKYAGY